MRNSDKDSGSQLTRMLVAAIVVAVITLTWLIYAQLIAPRLAANVALVKQICLNEDKLCLNYPESWSVSEQSAKDSLFYLKDGQASVQLVAGVGQLEVDTKCDQREARPLYIVSSQPTNLTVGAGDDGRAVNIVQAVIETPADGFYVPAIYLTDRTSHYQPGELQSCGLEGANVVQLSDGSHLTAAIDSPSETIGTNAPAYRSLGGAKEWLQSPEAAVVYRVLSSVEPNVATEK